MTPNGFERIEGKVPAVRKQKKARCDPRDTLVAVCEGVVRHQAVGVGCRQRGSIRLAVRNQIPWSRQSRVDQPKIKNAVGSGMLGNLAIVNGQDDLQRNPLPWSRLS